MKNIQFKISHVVIAGLSIGLSLSPAYSWAHAHLHQSVPADKAVLKSAPSKVTLEFTEELETAMSKVVVKNSKTGEVVSEGKLSDGGTGNAGTLEIALKPLKKAKTTYVVDWKAVSRDTHRMQGKMTFTVDPK